MQDDGGQGFYELPAEEQHTRIKKRVKTLSQKIYKQMHIAKVIEHSYNSTF